MILINTEDIKIDYSGLIIYQKLIIVHSHYSVKSNNSR